MSEQLKLLGVRLAAFDLPSAVAEMEEAIVSGRKTYACACSVNDIVQAQKDPAVLRALDGAGWNTTDGMPLVWSLRFLGARKVSRVYGPDLMLALTELSARKGYSQFYLGGAPGVADELADCLRKRFPGLKVAGTFCPPFRAMSEEEERAMVEQLNASGAQIVWVGLGAPKQDLWVERFRSRLDAPLLLAVGAAFDFLVGRTPQAPRWMQRSGLEWLFRLLCEPRRLWRRYLVNNPRFIWLVFLQLTGLRKFDSPR